ncbi:unnamed protein product [Rotaria sp. Silwood2]|nr:unnamed protein product [Rotaria sp. Silwood2]CAF3136796.1 unnamed protein product [Rotaria sp. Silwood2]CAF3451903.1 unnamed protein product [Rotaria sp. Silwood2]CAF4520477.1 unnamed protein product [Rotaria sp. Silwood2]CAF4564441.1 unnamed protein product [Rotaria sp. Silwood2]
MSNLEKLNLHFLNHNGPFIDGENLEKNTINYMTRLKKFTFNIRLIIPVFKLVNLRSIEEFQNTFRNFKNNQIISCVDYFRQAGLFHSHMYSYPYSLRCYEDIANNFPGGVFKCVREISLFDERPFEHEFFLRIARSFPFIEKLTLHNREPQKRDNQQWSILEYPHLTRFDLVRTHDNYVELFLINTKMSLLNNVLLHVNYGTLQRVTDNFTRDVTRFNCSKIHELLLHNKPQFSLHLKDYFPHAEIL